jgi:hypothetical protein
MKSFPLALYLIAMAFVSCDVQNTKKPIALHPENPHYFTYQDSATILVTSAEHYGAVINLDFDYSKYLDELSKHELNLTRTFTGAYVEPVGAFNIERNTLAPSTGRFICPWARSEIPGYKNAGNKFDLSKWDDKYFARLKDFVGQAAKRNIIVELALFCPFYEDSQWVLSPMNPINNVNGVGPADRTDVYTLDKSSGLLDFQDALVSKLVDELKEYPNLIYEICNEPYFGGVTMEWQHHIATQIARQEETFSNKHLISQNIANEKLKIEDPHPSVSVFNFHYANPPVAVSQNYQLNKVIGDNETGFDGNADSTYRKEAWEFILAGGALFNNLDYSFAAGHENGSFRYPPTQPGGGSSTYRQQLSYLKRFIQGFDFIKMKPDSTIVSHVKTQKVGGQVLATEGKQYAIYVYGQGPHNLNLTIPAGTYSVEFMDPLTGQYEGKQELVSKGSYDITTPPYREDVAVRVLLANDK